MAFIGRLFVEPSTFSCNATRALFIGEGECANCDGAESCAEGFAEIGKLSEHGFGVAQLLFLMAAYGYVLMNAATLIGDGAELLLLVPSMSTLVGTLVLPILGAVPDGAIVFFSGLGPSAQEDLSVGMGALAGSTIMLLTIPWFLSIYAGRVDIVNGECRYKVARGRRKLSEGRSMTQSGVAADNSVKTSCNIMLLTCISYVIIQAPALGDPKIAPTNSNHKDLVDGEQTFAAIGLGVTMFLFVAVCIYQVMTGGSEEVQNDLSQLIAQQRLAALQGGLMNFTGMFRDELLPLTQAAGTGEIGASLMMSSFSTSAQGANSLPDSTVQKVKDVLRPLFKKYDTDRSGDIDVHECRDLFRDLGEKASEEDLRSIISKYDEDGDGMISFDEFCTVMMTYAQNEHVYPPDGVLAITEEQGETNEEDDEEDDEEEEMPEDLAELDPEEQQKRIKRRALGKMCLGTMLVLLFSDPMCDCLSALGDRTGVPPFYISFVLAPLASNGTELLAAYNFALKKTRKSITVSLSQLEGAAIMNNTFCLGIFMFLIYLQDLTWAYTAETLSILLVQLLMSYFARKPVQTMLDGYLILAIFPMSILMVMFMENVLGWD